MYRRQVDRINEQDVPESQHTIFIRGLPGSITTSEIREFFEDSFGSCTFDFIKLSKDREKLHIAVRFVSKTAARECMDKYRDGELFGHPVQLTWFRDIRRYLNHVKQGAFRRRYEEERRRLPSRRNLANRSRTRSVSKSPNRRSQSPIRSRSRTAASSVHSTEQKQDVAETSLEPSRKSRKPKKERRRKRHHSISPSRSRSPVHQHNRELGDVSNGANLPESLHISLPKNNISAGDSVSADVERCSDMEASDGELPNSDFAANLYNQQLQSQQFGDSVLTSSSNVDFSQQPKKLQIADLRSSNLLQNTSFTVDLESNNPPRLNIRKDYNGKQNADNSESGLRKGVFLPVSTKNEKAFKDSDMEAEATKKFIHVKQELVERLMETEKDFQRQQKQNSSGSFDPVAAAISNDTNYADLDKNVDENLNSNKRKHRRDSTPEQLESKSETVPVFNGAMTNFKTIQRLILQDVRYKAQESTDKEKVGNYRLSALSTQKSMEEIRSEKMSRLSKELQEKVERKKLQLELSYRHDCETFGLMTRKLIGKDRTLEDRLRLALLEIMKDLEAEAMKNLDEYLDQMIFLMV